MYKKLITACMAIAAFAAFAVAPAASASPVLTETGVAVPVGALITGTSTGSPTFTGAFNVVCSKATLTGKVTKNSGTKIEGTILAKDALYTGTGTGGDCTSAFGSTKVTVNSELCLISGAAPADTFTVTGCGANVVFTLEVTGTGPCKYSTAVVNGTYTTNVSPAPLKVVKQVANKIEGGFFCPASGELDQEFDLYTDSAAETPLTIS